jgi:hypothetical protein
MIGSTLLCQVVNNSDETVGRHNNYNYSVNNVHIYL